MSPTKTPWAIILCKVADDSSEPETKTFFENLFTESGKGQNGMFDYWSDVSSGHISLEGSQVFGWYTLPHTAQAYADLTRGERVEEAIKLAKSKNAAVAKFARFVVLYNQDGDMGFAGHVILSVPAWRANSAAHEMGHGYGLGHSFDDSPTSCAPWGEPGEYCDHWCIMGSGLSINASAYPFGTAVSPNAPQLDKLGWIDGRTWNKTQFDLSAGNGKPHVVKLSPLSQKTSSGNLAAKIAFWEQGWNYYYVEFRKKSGWDVGVPSTCVLVHRTRFIDSHRPRLVAGQSGPALVAGEGFKDPEENIEIRVMEIDSAANEATISVGTCSRVTISGSHHVSEPDYEGSGTFVFEMGPLCPPKTLNFLSYTIDQTTELVATPIGMVAPISYNWTVNTFSLKGNGTTKVPTIAGKPKYPGDETSQTSWVTLTYADAGEKLILNSDRADGNYELEIEVIAIDSQGRLAKAKKIIAVAGIAFELDEEAISYISGCWEEINMTHLRKLKATVPVGKPPIPDPRLREGPAVQPADDLARSSIGSGIYQAISNAIRTSESQLRATEVSQRE